MITRIVLNIVVKDKNKYLVAKRSDQENLNPGVWEFPGGHLEMGQTIEETLRRELREELNLTDQYNSKIINYTDDIKVIDGVMSHMIHLYFLIEVNKEELDIKLSSEHSIYKWVEEDFNEFDLRKIVK